MRWGATTGAVLIAACGGGQTSDQGPRPVLLDPHEEAAPEPVPPKVVDIEVGGDAVCARIDDGSVYCWGDTYRGYSSWPRRVADLPPVKALSVGEDHACAIDQRGDLWCWGREDGAIGSWDYTARPGYGEPGKPHRIKAVEKLRTVSVGGSHETSVSRTCVVGEDGVLTCLRWELDHKRYEDLTDVDDVAVGHNLICILQQGVQRCADISHEQFHPHSFVARQGRSDLVSVAVSGKNHCGNSKDGRVFCWGPRFCREHRRAPPKAGQPMKLRPSTAKRWRQQTACELTESSATVRGVDGSLNGFITARDKMTSEWFVDVRGRYDKRDWKRDFVDVGIGRFVGCGLEATGEVSCWGSGRFGQLGRQSWPLGRRYRLAMAQVRAHDDMLCGVDPNVGVRCFVEAWRVGMGSDGKWLRGGVIPGTAETKTMHANDHGICVDLGAGVMRCTGDAQGTLLGWPSTETQTMSLNAACSVHGEGELHCRFDDDHDLVVTSDGQPLTGVIGIGLDRRGGFAINGDGVHRFNTRGRAELVPGLKQVDQLAVGRDFYCVRTSERVQCAGYGANGQLGNGTGRSSGQPQMVKGLPPVTLVRAGYRHACAVTKGGRLYCWGDNAYGQLGEGTRDTRWSATEVPNLGGVRDVSLGPRMTCAMRERDSICWGRRAALALDADRSAAYDPDLETPFVVKGFGVAAPTHPIEVVDVPLPPYAEANSAAP